MDTSQKSAPSATVAMERHPELSVDFADGDILLVDAVQARAAAFVAKLGPASGLPLCVAGLNPLAEALARPPKLVLLAVDVDDSDAVLQFLQQVRSHSPLRHIPVIALADNHEAAVRIKLGQLDVQGVVARSARIEQVASQIAAVRLSSAVCAERARNRNQCYQTLLNSMPDGFCIVKVLFDEACRPLDYRFLLVNAAFERTTGLNAAQGKLMRDLAPAHEAHWLELYGQVAKTGEPLHFERAAEQLHRWYEVSATRYGRPEDHEVAIFFKDITARKQAEQERQRALGMLQVAMRLGRVGAWSFDTASQQVHWSPEARAIHGLPDDFEVSLETAVALIDETARPYVDAAMQACITTGEPFDVEARAWTFLRKPLWIRLIGEAVRDERGAIVRVQGAVQDITDLTRASEEVRDLSNQLGETLESMTDGFFTLSDEHRFLYVNGNAERLLRRCRAELVGKTLWEAAPHLAGTQIQQALTQAQAQFTTVETEFYSERLAIWLALRFCPSERGLAVYFRHISDEKSRQRALTASEDHHRLLFETSLDGIVQTGPQGNIVRANQAACRFFAMSEFELCGLNMADLFAADDKRLNTLLLNRARAGSTRGELTALRSDGSRVEVEVVFALYRTSNGEGGSYAVMRDISECKRAENDAAQTSIELARRVRERTADLETANRELKQFSQALAHDIRGPIAAISAFAQALARDLAAGESKRARGYVDRILQGVHRVNEYTDALLSLVRVSHMQMRPKDVNLSALAEDILDELRAREPDREVLVQVDPDLRARGDSMLLRMALQNLLANAWKFTSRRRRASVCFRAERRADGTVVYQVRDNGAGFDPEQRSRLFGSFQRLHREDEFPGTGIGLASVHRIISRHGGQVWAEGAVNEGATFYFTLENVRGGAMDVLYSDAPLRAR